MLDRNILLKKKVHVYGFPLVFFVLPQSVPQALYPSACQNWGSIGQRACFCFTQHYIWHNSIRNDELCRSFWFFDTPLWYAWKSYWCFKHLYQRLCYCVWSIPHGFVSHDSVVDYCCLSRSAAITCSWWKSIIILTLFESIVLVDLYHKIPHY